MCKKTPIEPANAPKGRSTNHQRGTRSPKDISHSVILPAVFLHGLKNTATAVGITQAVEVTACRSGILEMSAGVFGAQLGLAGGDLWMGLHIFVQGLQPAFGCLHIGVEKEIIVIALPHPAQRLVVALGKAVVAIEDYRCHLRELRGENSQGVVGGAVVGNDDGCQRRGGIGEDRG